MNAWRWWWCFLLIIQLGTAEKISVQEDHVKEKMLGEHKQENQEARKKRHSESLDEINDEDEDPNQPNTLLMPIKRKPILSTWGGKRLSQYLYYKRKPAFSSWGGKRGPAFSSWGGKRSGNIYNNKELNETESNSTEKENNRFTKNYQEFENNNYPYPENDYDILQKEFSNQILKENGNYLKRMFELKKYPSYKTQNTENVNNPQFDLIPVPNRINEVVQKIYQEIFKLNRSPSNNKIPQQLRNNEKDEDSNAVNILNDIQLGQENDIITDLNFEDGKITLSNLFDKKSSPFLNSWGEKRVPAFNSWGGKRALAFNSWGGKRAQAFNSWGGKRAPAFNSWGGKRASSLNNWREQRAQAFNSWGGKRAPAFNSWGGKRAPAFNSWGGKRAPAFNSWGGKRVTAFNSWGGKRAPAFNSWGGKRATAFNSWGGKRSESPIEERNISPNFKNWNANSEIIQTPEVRKKRSLEFYDWEGKQKPDIFENLNEKKSLAFNSWGGKRQYLFDDGAIEENESDDDKNNLDLDSWQNDENLKFNDREKKRAPAVNSWEGNQGPIFNSWEDKRAPAFNSWGGKRSPESNSKGVKSLTSYTSWSGKRMPAFHSWGGKRSAAFNSWGGKRAPAFNSWGGKRAPAFNSWGGKRAPAFNSWGGKRAPAFTSWGGKRAPAFNSWGGKRAPAFNSWGGKRATAFNSWGGKRAPAFNSWGGKRIPAFNSWDSKRATAFNSWGGKRAPAFNSWGGKRAPAFNSWGGKRNTEGVDDKRDSFNGWSHKRLPAFHSWGGKRTDPLNYDTSEESDDKNYFLDVYNFDDFFNSNPNTNEDYTPNLSEDINDNENNISDERSLGRITQTEDNFPFLDNNNAIKLTQNRNDKNNSETFQQTEKDHINLFKREEERKRNPAFFSWGGKRSEVPNEFQFSENGDLRGIDNDRMTYQNLEDLFVNEDSNLDNENHNINKRSQELRYFSRYLPLLMRSGYGEKRRPAFSSWGGKRSDRALHEVDTDTSNSPPFHNREKRDVANDAGKSVILNNDNKIDNTLNKDFDLLSSNDILSDIPIGTMMCCIKRVQYGDRNLFMQMLLRTKSFRDLSWPTIRPIRRGSDFYPWGGKRSSL